MPVQKEIRVIIDTNLWISFLIGKKLRSLKNLVVEKKITLIVTDQILEEIKIVSHRPDFRKYFPVDEVERLFKFLDIIAVNVPVKKIVPVCRDPKDDFLIALAITSKADYLVTGDKDILELPHKLKTKIVSAKEFEQLLS